MAHADFSLLITPNMVTVQCPGNTGVFPSPLVAAQQTLDRGGQKWRLTLTFSNKITDDRAVLMALIVGLRGRAGRVEVQAWDNPRRGAYGGTPLVDGAAQTGGTIDIKGCSNNITNWIRAGDYFALAESGVGQMKMAVADASSDGAGLITALQFEPRIRVTPPDNSAVAVDDGVLSPTLVSSVYYLENDAQGWTSRPHAPRHLSDIVLVLVEDVFATHP